MNSCVVLTASAFLLRLLYDCKNAEDGSSISSETSGFLQTARRYKQEDRTPHILHYLKW
jgi:hypothetical protein